MFMQLQPVSERRTVAGKGRETLFGFLKSELDALVLVLGILLLIARSGVGLST
jgi:hypothetical protein